MMVFSFNDHEKSLDFVNTMNDDKAVDVSAAIVTCTMNMIEVRIKAVKELSSQEWGYVVDLAEVFYNGKVGVVR